MCGRRFMVIAQPGRSTRGSMRASASWGKDAEHVAADEPLEIVRRSIGVGLTAAEQEAMVGGAPEVVDDEPWSEWTHAPLLTSEPARGSPRGSVASWWFTIGMIRDSILGSSRPR